jgi:hypothetical protein
MAQEAANEMRGFVLTYRQNDQTAAIVTKFRRSKSEIAGEERWLRKREQERKNFLVSHAFAPEFDSNLTNGEFPTSQQLPLALENIFVENIHARLNCQFVSVFLKTGSGQSDGFGDRFLSNAPAPFFNNASPRHARCDLFENVGDQNASTAESRLPVADLFIRDDITTYGFFAHTRRIIL